VPAKVEFNVTQAALGVGVSVDTHILDKEVFRLDGGLEALCTVPSHVLDCDACAFGDQDEVRETVYNYSTFRLLDHIRENAERRRNRRVAAGSAGRRIDIHVSVRTCHPVDVWCVNGILDVGSVEIDELLREPRESKDTPKVRPCIGYAINVKRGV